MSGKRHFEVVANVEGTDIRISGTFLALEQLRDQISEALERGASAARTKEGAMTVTVVEPQ